MVTSIAKLSSVLEDALREYNELNATMDLVLFEDAMKHIARIVRVVMNSGGHALLVGVGGSGKQSLSRLAAFICNYMVNHQYYNSHHPDLSLECQPVLYPFIYALSLLLSI
jgi:dynein heavy chain